MVNPDACDLLLKLTKDKYDEEESMSYKDRETNILKVKNRRRAFKQDETQKEEVAKVIRRQDMEQIYFDAFRVNMLMNCEQLIYDFVPVCRLSAASSISAIVVLI